MSRSTSGSPPRQLPSPPVDDVDEGTEQTRVESRPIDRTSRASRHDDAREAQGGASGSGDWTIYRVDESVASARAAAMSNSELATSVVEQWENVTAEERERLRQAAEQQETIGGASVTSQREDSSQSITRGDLEMGNEDEPFAGVGKAE